VADVHHDRDGAQGAEDPAGPQGIADALVDAVLERDLDIVADDLDVADQDHDDDIIGASQRLTAVCGRLYLGGEAALADDALCHAAGILEALRVDVHENEGALPQFGE
jgi:hypothetical protein